MLWKQVVAALLIVCLTAGVTVAQTPMADPVDPTPAQVQDLRQLLADPVVQEWLRSAAPPPAAAPPEATPEHAGLRAALTRMTIHRGDIIAALPRLPAALATAWHNLTADAATGGDLLTLLLIGALVSAGLLVEWRFQRMTRVIRKSVLTSSEDTVPDRLRKLALRGMLAAGAVIAFAVSSLGVLLVIDLPPLVRDVVARMLVATILFRITLHACRIVLAPAAPERRVLPLPEDLAVFWVGRIALFSAIMLAGWAISSALPGLGAPHPAPMVIAYLFGLVLLVIWVATFLQRFEKQVETAPFALSETLFWVLWAVVLYGLWAFGAMNPFWLLLFGGMLFPAISIVNRMVNHLLHRSPTPEDPTPQAPPSVLAAVIERGARSGLVLAAAAMLLWAWGISFADLLESSDRRAIVARVLIYVALIAAIFDFIWHVARTAIDTYVADAALVSVDMDEARRRARLRTLLPILRNVLQVALGGIAILMALASLGIDIAPLIAGAGILGVAIGFGAQGLVKDIIAGMFYLLDDAFRVGEYIITGSYKGTVESFSLRSIKLRHHRGYLYTIPFGSLGAIQNMSREWVIEKLAFTVPFGTDVAKVKKIIKGVNAELQANPDVGPKMLEPLKSQGADQIADSGLLVKVKFMAIPGEQFIVRRTANDLIQKAFAENGIEFAFPTVRVVGADDHDEQMAAVAASRRLTPPVPPPAPEPIPAPE